MRISMISRFLMAIMQTLSFTYTTGLSILAFHGIRPKPRAERDSLPRSEQGIRGVRREHLAISYRLRAERDSFARSEGGVWGVRRWLLAISYRLRAERDSFARSEGGVWGGRR